MNFIKTKLRGCFIVEPVAFGDNRGWFMETYSKGEFDKAGLMYDFVQDNQSFSKQKGIPVIFFAVQIIHLILHHNIFS